jgi:hypothetical protein
MENEENEENVIVQDDSVNEVVPESDIAIESDVVPESDVDVPESEVTPEKPKKKKRWSSLKQEREEKRQLLAEVESLRQQNSHTADLLNKSLTAGSSYYSEVAANSLDKAKANLAKALGEGDVDAVATATSDIAHATSIFNESKRIPSSQPNYNNPVQQDTARQDAAQQDVLYDWLDDNPELDKTSDGYNEGLTKQVLPFINKLENRLKRNNQMHLLASPNYFKLIDEYVDKLKNNKEVQGKHFGGVRSRQQSSSLKDNKTIVLTPQQKKAAIAFNMTEEKYINYLKKYENEGK